MPAGRPSHWDTGGGRTPYTIGGQDEKYDARGLFKEEHDEVATWDTFIHAFTQQGGGTERAWDKKTRNILKDRLAHYLKIANKRIIKAIAVAAAGRTLNQQKTDAKRAKDAYEKWLEADDGVFSGEVDVTHIPRTISGTTTDIFMTELATTLAVAIPAQTDDTLAPDGRTDAWADALKQKLRVVVHTTRAKLLKDEHKDAQRSWKNLVNEMKTAHDDIVFLINVMKEAKQNYDAASASQALESDEAYELPKVEDIENDMPSRNLRRSDGLATTTSGSTTASSGGASSGGAPSPSSSAGGGWGGAASGAASSSTGGGWGAAAAGADSTRGWGSSYQESPPASSAASAHVPTALSPSYLPEQGRSYSDDEDELNVGVERDMHMPKRRRTDDASGQ
jgi:hypothetical protein